MKPILVILGMHRSGTSMLTRMCNLLGADLGPDMLVPGPDNPSGYWEHRGVVSINNRIMAAADLAWNDPLPLPENWLHRTGVQALKGELVELLARDFANSALPAVKDPRICRLLPLWQLAIAELDWRPRYLLMARNPLEVERSLATRDGLIPELSLLLWLRYVLESERHTRGETRAILTYDRLLAQWQTLLEPAFRRLDLPFPSPAEAAFEAIDGFTDAGKRHHQSSTRSLGAHPGVGRLLHGMYANFTGAVDDPETADAGFPRLQAEFDDILYLLDPVFAQLREHGSDVTKKIAATSTGQAEKIIELEKEVESARRTAGAIDEKARDLDTRLDKAQRELASTRLELDRVRQALAESRHALDAREQSLEEMRATTSWRMTGPLRAASEALGKFLGRRRPGRGS